MTKDEAMAIFAKRGRKPTGAALARAVRLTPQAIYQWPEELGKTQEDAVIGACVRLGKAIPEQLRKRK